MALTFDQEADYKRTMLQVTDAIGECFVAMTRKGIDPVYAVDLVKLQFATMMNLKFATDFVQAREPAAKAADSETKAEDE